jgi:glutamate N-acetyltransferase/amino-acid N-acetyltransferase
LIMANAVSGSKEITQGSAAFKTFSKHLAELSLKLAHMIVRDGEGASKFIEINVKGAATIKDAERATSAIADSYLVKTAMFGSDPNWGRILAVLGRAKIKVDGAKVDISLNGIKVAKNGVDNDQEKNAARVMKKKDIVILVDLKIASAKDTRWTSDLTYDYVKLNSAYRT